MAKSEGIQAASGDAPWPNVVRPPVSALTSAPVLDVDRVLHSQLAPPITAPTSAATIGQLGAVAPAPPLPVVPTVPGAAPIDPNATPPISGGRNAPPTANAANDSGDEVPEDPFDIAARLAPPWLISSVLHMLILIILGLCLAANIKKPQVELQVAYAEAIGDQLLDDSISIATPTPDPIAQRAEMAISDLPPVTDPFAAPPVAQLLPQFKTGEVFSKVPAAAIGNPLSGRQAGRKRVLLDRYGGDASTESAVANALAWLKRNQRQDGSWSLSGPYQNGGVSENPIAATAMALLAFQGAGHTHLEGDHKGVVQLGWSFLLKQQNGEGLFSGDIPSSHLIYSHAQATIALCELYGMTNDARLLAPTDRAVKYCVRIQAPEGGWKYTPGNGSDMSVTGWVVMALQSAKMAGLEVPPQTLQKTTTFIDSVSLEDGTRYVYQPGELLRDPTMTAEALLCRQYLGWSRDDERLNKGVEYLLEHPIGKGEHNVYYWYYATQVMHHMEGEPWQKWNAVMRQYLPQTQLKAGNEAGSWDPGSASWDNIAGRLYVTCLSTYMLEVYYRHLPIYTKVFDQR